MGYYVLFSFSVMYEITFKAEINVKKKYNFSVIKRMNKISHLFSLFFFFFVKFTFY